MKRTVVHIAILFSLCPFLIQCVATEKEMDSMGRHLHSVDSRVTGLDQEIDALKSETFKDVQARQAQSDNRLDRLQEEIMKLQGQLEENLHQNRLIREENKQLESALSAKLNNLAENNRAIATQHSARMDQAVAANETQLNQLRDQLAQLDERIAKVDNAVDQIKAAREKEAVERAMEAAERARETAARIREAEAKVDKVVIYPEKQKTSPTETEKVDEGHSEKAGDPVTRQYDEAFALYKAKNYSRAHDAFEEFLKRNPDSKNAAEARYRLADSLFAQQQYEPAILEFQKVIVEHPQHTLVPAAYFKQGMAFEKLNDPVTAGIIYKKIVDDFQGTEQAEIANKRLDALK